jgi:hypothetical protein
MCAILIAVIKKPISVSLPVFNEKVKNYSQFFKAKPMENAKYHLLVSFLCDKMDAVYVPLRKEIL